jgi:inosine-uridine nucleoside N-ribohydrolase
MSGADAPVACGRSTPLAGSNVFPQEWRAYTDDLANRLNLPAPAGPAYDGTAVDLLIDSLHDDTTLLTLGPLTNVAEALRREPGVAEVVQRVVSMAGAVDVPGNAPNRVAEYNVWIDAQAAKEVLAALPVELVPLDASNEVPATTFFVELLGRHLRTPSARIVHALLDQNAQVADGTYYFWDPLAAVLVVEPDIARWEEDGLLVTASLDAGAGWISRWDRRDPVRYATHADWERFERGFLGALTGGTVGRLRPAPDLTASFDGRRCTLEGDTLDAGRFVIRFENHSRGDASVIVGTMDGITYRDLLAYVGRPGSLVAGAPDGFTPVAVVNAAPGASALEDVDVDAGAAGAFCLVSVSGEAARVWPGGGVVFEG